LINCITVHIETSYCKECKANVEPNCSLEEHQYSRQHINSLLQFGMEIPISFLTEENELPEGMLMFIFYSDHLL